MPLGVTFQPPELVICVVLVALVALVALVTGVVPITLTTCDAVAAVAADEQLPYNKPVNVPAAPVPPLEAAFVPAGKAAKRSGFAPFGKG